MKNSGNAFPEIVYDCTEDGTIFNVGVSKKSPFISVLAILVCTCIVVGVIITLSSSGYSMHLSPENLVREIIEARSNRDGKIKMQANPDWIVRDLALRLGLGEDATREDVEAIYSERYKNASPFAYEIFQCTTYEISVDTVPQVLESNYNMTTGEYQAITDAAVVEVGYVVWGLANYEKVYCIKMDGKWYLLNVFEP